MEILTKKEQKEQKMYFKFLANAVDSEKKIDYFNHHALSRSSLCDLKISPYRFWHKNILGQKHEPTKEMLLGSAFHSIVLEPDTFDSLYSVSPNIDKRTKIGKKLFNDFLIKNENKKIIDHKDFDLLQNMKLKLQQNKIAIKMLEQAKDKEQEYYFNYEGLELKAKLDAVDTNNNIIIDLKTVASIESDDDIAKKFINYHYSEQVFMYSLAYELKYNLLPDFYIIAVEKKEPFEVKVYKMSNYFYALGQKNILNLIQKYKDCVNRWGLSSDVPWLEEEPKELLPPKWVINQFDNEFDSVDELLI